MTKRFLLTMLITLAFGAALAAADPALYGAWIDEWNTEQRFDNGAWETWSRGSPVVRGTYTVSGDTITLMGTYVYDSAADSASETEWHSRRDIVALSIAEFKAILEDDAFLDEFLTELADYPPGQLRQEMNEAMAELDELIAELHEVFPLEFAEVSEMVAEIMNAELDAGSELAGMVTVIAEFLTTALLVELQEELEALFGAETGTYSISGDTLTIEWEDGWTEVFTRRP